MGHLPHLRTILVTLLGAVFALSGLALLMDLSALRMFVNSVAESDERCGGLAILHTLDRQISSKPSTFLEILLTLADAFSGTLEDRQNGAHYEFTLKKRYRATFLPVVVSRRQIVRAFCSAGYPGGELSNLPSVVTLLQVKGGLTGDSCELEMAIDVYIKQMRFGWKFQRLEQEYAVQVVRLCRH